MIQSGAGQAKVDLMAMPVAAPATSGWLTAWAMLGGVALGCLGVWLWVRRPAPVAGLPAAPPPAAEPVRKKPAENVRRTPVEPPAAEPAGKGVSVQSLRQVQDLAPKKPDRPLGTDKK